MATPVTKLKCDRCESQEEAKAYDPRTAGHPHKKVDLCGKCAAKDPKAVLIDNVVPKIEPALPSEPKTVSIPTPKNAPPQDVDKPVVVETDEPAPSPASNEPIDRQVIRDKLAIAEKELNSAIESKRRVLGQAEQVKSQLVQVQNVINVKSVEIASYRGILGNEG